MDLFEHSLEDAGGGSPLADRLRPRTLDEIAGQDHLLGPGRFLRQMVERDELPSLVLWGPPGSGKTTIARVVAGITKAHFEPLSAVMSGVKDLREALAAAAARQKFRRQKTILFIDELHRYNKAQQDALLPAVEKGTVTLIGATTENPSFEVTAALLSRCRVVTLSALTEEQLAGIVRRGLADEERGLGTAGLTIADEALRAIAAGSYGDARRALTALEISAQLAAAGQQREISPAIVEEALQHKALVYDRAGEEHYNVVSALIKSLRGSDPDAAVYWLTRMLEAGEDPLFIVRRMVIFASEDVGNADPRALLLAVACQQAVHFLGLPEAGFAMCQTALYLACAPKSNSALAAWTAARQAVKDHGSLPVPLHLRNAPTNLMKNLGYGTDYKYPHNFAGHYVVENYLPEMINGQKLYEPADSGYEKTIAQRLQEWRAARPGQDEKKDK